MILQGYVCGIDGFETEERTDVTSLIVGIVVEAARNSFDQ